MDRLLNDYSCDPDTVSPLTLAFLGDCVYDLFVREMLVCRANRPTRKLHACAVERVRAAAQAKASERIFPILDEKEQAVFKRGRNAHPHHIPKNGNPRDYHYATAMESLFGYLYLKGEISRLRELFSLIIEEEENEKAQKA